MEALAGVDALADYGAAQVTGGRLGLQGASVATRSGSPATTASWRRSMLPVSRWRSVRAAR